MILTMYFGLLTAFAFSLERKYQSYHPQKISDITMMSHTPKQKDTLRHNEKGKENCKEKEEGELFLYKGQEVIQVVEELMEQTCILKDNVQEMIDKFKNKICCCKLRIGETAERRTASDSKLCGCPLSMKLSPVKRNSKVESLVTPPLPRLKAGFSDTVFGPESESDSLLQPKQEELDRKMRQVQDELLKLQCEVARFSPCLCTDKGSTPDKTQGLSSQLLDKAEEIKDILIGMKTDFCDQQTCHANEGSSFSGSGQETLTRKCETEVKRLHPDYTKTVNQTQNVDAERTRKNNVEMTNRNEVVQTNVDVQGKENEALENIQMRATRNEQLEKLSSDDKTRKSTCLSEKTVRAGANAYKEVNTVTENDVVYPEGRVIRTSKKTVRTEIVEGAEPKEKILTNIRIKRTINNRTGEVKEVIYEGDALSDDDDEEERSLMRRRRQRTGQHSPPKLYNMTPTSSAESASLVINRRSYQNGDVKSPRSPQSFKISSPPRSSHEENPLFFNGAERRSKRHDSKSSRIQYIATSAEVPGRSLVGCKFSEELADSRTKNDDLNLGGRADSYFVELVNKSQEFQSNALPRLAAGGGSLPGSHDDTRSQHRNDPMNSEVSMRSIDVDNIQNVIKQLSGNRPYDKFFISVLPEKYQSKNFRINVVDKDTGNLLGYFYVEENKFHQARRDGIFDKFLSLFVLNSLGSYNDFKGGINPQVLKKEQCFGDCVCQPTDSLHSSEANHHDKLTISPSGGEVIHFVNDSHIVTCDSHKKDVKVQWLKPEGEVVGGEKGRLHIENMANGQLALVFEQISLADKGEWTCATEDGEATKKFKMVVNQPISFMDTAIVQTAKEGKDATIRCEVKGDPEPLVSWSFNGVAILLSHPKFTKLADGLLIKRVSKNDSGEYTCRAFQVSETTSNVEEQTIRLNIQHKPTAPQRKAADIQYGYVGGMVNLTCEAEAEPQANFTWFRHGKKVNSKYYNIYTGNHTSLLQIFVNDSAQFGEYKCKAANMLGSIERIITLQEGTKPFPPIQVTLRGVNSDTFDIDVLADRSNAQSDMDVIGFRFELIPDQEYLSSGGRWNKAKVLDFGYEDGATYLITNMTPNTTYHARVASRNLAGLSDWSDVKKFTTHAREPIMYTSQAPSVLDYAEQSSGRSTWPRVGSHLVLVLSSTMATLVAMDATDFWVS